MSRALAPDFPNKVLLMIVKRRYRPLFNVLTLIKFVINFLLKVRIVLVKLAKPYKLKVSSLFENQKLNYLRL